MVRIGQKDEQLKLGGGYDHNWVYNRTGAAPPLAARVEEPSTGRVLEVLTTHPGVQFYTANFLDGSIQGKGWSLVQPALRFLTGDAAFSRFPNQSRFPSTELKPGRSFVSTAIFRLLTGAGRGSK